MIFIQLFIFHFKIFAKNKYFLTLMLTTTISILISQYIIAYSTDNLDDTTIWIRSAIFGLWSTTITAAGMITFQKFLGTLPYLLNNNYSVHKTIISLVLPCSSFGLLAFPVSIVFAKILNLSILHSSSNMILGVTLLYSGAVSYSLVIAPLFVLTRNAIIYEQVLNIPVILISGIFDIGFISDKFLDVMQYFNPISGPIRYLMGYTNTYMISTMIAQIIWFSASYFIINYIMKKMKTTGKIEVL